MVWVGGTSADDCERAIAGSRAAGYDLVELPVFEPSVMPVDAIVRSLARHDLGVRCSLGLSRDADISSADPAISARGETLLHDVIAVARDIGADLVGGVISSAMTKYLEMPSAAGRANAVAAFQRLAAQAAASDITLGIEVVNRYESNLINTAEQAVAFIAEIGAPNVVVHLDSYHMNIEENDFRTPVLACGDKLGYVHMGGNNRGYLGAGHIDFSALFGALREVGYTGAVTLEASRRRCWSRTCQTRWGSGATSGATARIWRARRAATSPISWASRSIRNAGPGRGLREGSTMDLGLKGKVACITGGSVGIGLAVADRAGRRRHGHRDRGARAGASGGGGRRIAAAFGVRAVGITADVSTAEGCDTVIAAVQRDLGGVDILINNAGSGSTRRSWRPPTRSGSTTGSCT